MSQPIDPAPDSQPDPAPQIDKMKYDHFMQQVRDDQNLTMAVIGALIATIAGAYVWGVITNVTGYQIGMMAIGVGYLIGFAVRKLGNGIDKIFGITGAFFALIGCLGGNLYSSCIYISNQQDILLSDVLSRLDLDLIINIFVETFSPIDILFYGFAIYYGYKYSFRVITDEEIKPLLRQG